MRLFGGTSVWKDRRVRVGLCAALLVPLALGGVVAMGEAFQQGGPIGSQTKDGYNALGPVVTQPIEFPHYIHVQQMGIDCLYCHTYARRSAVSGIPRLDKCVGCHNAIPEVRDKPRIKTLFEYWDKKQAIPWKKVHDLPDFVRFNHERHIQRFIFDQGRPTREVCGYCHGDVGTMTTRATGQGDFDGMVHQLSREGSQAQRGERRDQPRAERLLAMPQMSRQDVESLARPIVIGESVR